MKRNSIATTGFGLTLMLLAIFFTIPQGVVPIVHADTNDGTWDAPAASAQGTTQTSGLPSSQSSGLPPSQSSGLPSSQSSGLPSSQVSGQISNTGQGFQLTNPLSVSSICGLIKKVLGAILALGIPIAMLFLVYAGFLFVIARGSPTGLQKAKDNLLHVVMGIGIFLGAWFLGQIIANTINAVQPGSVSGINSCN
jgi:hypothetical protein